MADSGGKSYSADMNQEDLLSLSSFAEPIADAATQVSDVSTSAVEAIKGLEGFDMYIYGSSSFYEDPAAAAVKDQIEGGTQALNDLRDTFEDCREQTLKDWTKYKDKVTIKITQLNSDISAVQKSIESHQTCSKNHDDKDAENYCDTDHKGKIAELETRLKKLQSDLKTQQDNLKTANAKITETKNWVNPVVAILSSFISTNTPFQKTPDTPTGSGSGDFNPSGGSPISVNGKGDYVVVINGEEQTFKTKDEAIAALSSSANDARNGLVGSTRDTNDSVSVIELGRNTDGNGNTVITMSDGTTKTILADGTVEKRGVDGSLIDSYKGNSVEIEQMNNGRERVIETDDAAGIRTVTVRPEGSGDGIYDGLEVQVQQYKLDEKTGEYVPVKTDTKVVYTQNEDGTFTRETKIYGTSSIQTKTELVDANGNVINGNETTSVIQQTTGENTTIVDVKKDDGTSVNTKTYTYGDVSKKETTETDKYGGYKKVTEDTNKQGETTVTTETLYKTSGGEVKKTEVQNPDGTKSVTVEKTLPTGETIVTSETQGPDKTVVKKDEKYTYDGTTKEISTVTDNNGVSSQEIHQEGIGKNGEKTVSHVSSTTSPTGEKTVKIEETKIVGGQPEKTTATVVISQDGKVIRSDVELPTGEMKSVEPQDVLTGASMAGAAGVATGLGINHFTSYNPGDIGMGAADSFLVDPNAGSLMPADNVGQYGSYDYSGITEVSGKYSFDGKTYDTRDAAELAVREKAAALNGDSEQPGGEVPDEIIPVGENSGDSNVTTKTYTKADGTEVTVETEIKPDGTKVIKETDGDRVITTTTDGHGNRTKVIEEEGKPTITIDTKRDADGNPITVTTEGDKTVTTTASGSGDDQTLQTVTEKKQGDGIWRRTDEIGTDGDKKGSNIYTRSTTEEGIVDGLEERFTKYDGNGKMGEDKIVKYNQNEDGTFTKVTITNTTAGPITREEIVDADGNLVPGDTKIKIENVTGETIDKVIDNQTKEVKSVEAKYDPQKTASPTVTSPPGGGGGSTPSPTQGGGGGGGGGGARPQRTSSPYVTPTRTTFSPTPSRTTFSPTPSRTTFSPTPSRTTFSPTPSRTTFSPTSSTTTIMPTQGQTSGRYYGGGGTGIMNNGEEIVEDAVLDVDVEEEGIPSLAMSNIKPVLNTKESGNKTAAVLSGLAATGAVAGGLAYVKKKKEEEEKSEAEDMQVFEDDILGDEDDNDFYGDKVTAIDGDKAWLHDYGLGLPTASIDDDDLFD